MKRMSVGAAVVAIAIAVAAAPFAGAAPVPQPGASCSQAVANAMTQLPDLMTFLQCRGLEDGEFRWQSPDSPYPHSDRWLSYGPALTLHGEGQRNREIDSGEWAGYPQADDSRCEAAQLDNAAEGERTPPQVAAGGGGQPLRVALLPMLFTVELRGYCLWQKVQ
jgi:hypothetical protein